MQSFSIRKLKELNPTAIAINDPKDFVVHDIKVLFPSLVDLAIKINQG